MWNHTLLLTFRQFDFGVGYLIYTYILHVPVYQRTFSSFLLIPLSANCCHMFKSLWVIQVFYLLRTIYAVNQFCSGWETIMSHYSFLPFIVICPNGVKPIKSSTSAICFTATIRSLLNTRVILAPMLFSAFYTLQNMCMPYFSFAPAWLPNGLKIAHWQCEQIGPKYHMANIFVYTDFFSQLYFNTNVASKCNRLDS